MKFLINSYNDAVPLYNIRIFRSYIDYVQNSYPDVDIDKILKFSGVTRIQLNDYGFWCNQKQMNRLQEILIKETGNRNIARDTGRNLINTQNFVALYVFGFINPINLTKHIEKVYNKLSRAAIIKINYLGENRYELITIPAPGVKEELYQCNNRMGSFEGLLKSFLHEFPKIEHPECYHQGAKQCRYIVSWDKTRGTLKWFHLRNQAILLGLLLSLITILFLPLSWFLVGLILFGSGIYFLNHKIQKIEINKLSQNIKDLGKTAEDYWNELNVRYNVTKLVQEVGEITSVIQSEVEISSAVSAVMHERLDYDRGAILLAKDDKRALFFTGGYGFTKDEVKIMKEAQFRLDNQINEGILQKVFIKQEPIIIDDINKIAHTLNVHNRNLAKKLGIQSMICVPVLHEGESLGVMAVDSFKSHYEFREGDINLLMAVASQTAVSIAHARAFQQLQESEKKHRTFVETIRDIVYTVDLEGRFTYVSPIVAKIAGYDDRDLIGRKFIEIVDYSYRELVLQKFSDGLKSRKTTTYEIKILTKDESTVPVELNVAPLTDNKGRSIGRIGVARDITKRYEEEAKRKEMEMRALSQDKLASVGEIATGVAHEINQPLSYIKIILESTLSDIEKEQIDKEEISEDFNESLRQVRKITNIISHLRTFGRSDVSSFSPVNLSMVLDDALILMKERLRIKNITIDIQGTDMLPMLYGNHAKLEQVFVNLIQNSMDALEKQGHGKINLTAYVESTDVFIVFSDTGDGIDQKLQEKIFEPFFTTKDAGKGTGIGLSIVYGIIQEHKGTITCESERGNGTTFKIRLPLFDEKADS